MNFFKFFFIISLFSVNLFSNFLDKQLPSIKKISKDSYEDLPTREYENITLETNEFGEIKFSISLPKDIKKDENVLILLDGLETGKKSLTYIPHPPNYVIIGYEFSKNLQRLKKKSVFLHLPSTRKAVLDVPFKLLGIVKWVEKQPWYSKKNIAIIGVSFGAIFVPATYHLAEINHMHLGLGIIAFGGANLYDIFYANLKNYKFLKAPIAYLAYELFKPIDPVFHLPYIHGKFLIINGTKDKNIPFKSAQKLQELTPEPKTIVNIDTEHMDPEKPIIINKVAEISLEWLKKNQ